MHCISLKSCYEPMARVYFNAPFEATTIRGRLDFKGGVYRNWHSHSYVHVYSFTSHVVYALKMRVHIHTQMKRTAWTCGSVSIGVYNAVMYGCMQNNYYTSGSKLMTLAFRHWSKLVAGDTQERCTYTNSFSPGYYYSCWHIATMYVVIFQGQCLLRWVGRIMWWH